MDRQLYEWMAPTIDAVQPHCDEPLIAAGTFQIAGGWAAAATGGTIGALLGTVLRRMPKHVRKRSGGLPDTVVVAVGRTKVYVFPYRTRRMRLETGPPVRVWSRSDVVARSDVRAVASKLTIDVRSTGDHHELESTSMTGRLGKITKEVFRLLDDPGIGSPTLTRHEEPPRVSTRRSDARLRRLGELADEIEAELRRLGWWIPDPPPEDTVVAGGAFGTNAVAFPTWLQVVFVKRLRQVAAGEFPIPSSSSVSTFAIREFDGYGDATGRLMDLLHEADRIVRAGV